MIISFSALLRLLMLVISYKNLHNLHHNYEHQQLPFVFLEINFFNEIIEILDNFHLFIWHKFNI